jgi:hypothetical protein
VHELPAADRFFNEVSKVSKPGAQLLLVEPAGHVKVAQFDAQLKAASEAGFEMAERPSIRRSHAALLRKG